MWSFWSHTTVWMYKAHIWNKNIYVNFKTLIILKHSCYACICYATRGFYPILIWDGIWIDISTKWPWCLLNLHFKYFIYHVLGPWGSLVFFGFIVSRSIITPLYLYLPNGVGNVVSSLCLLLPHRLHWRKRAWFPQVHSCRRLSLHRSLMWLSSRGACLDISFRLTKSTPWSVCYFMASIFSSPEHEVLMVSYCGQWLSVVRRPSSVVCQHLMFTL